jgi:uncharacterized protein (TIGR04255 family)
MPGWFNPYDIREVHDLFRDRYPSAERQPPFMGLVAFPPPNGPHAIQFATNADLNRWWFVDLSGANLVQVQENFIAHNWRRLTPPPSEIAPYPGFEAIYRDFRSTISKLEEWSSNHGRKIGEPFICELLYEDLIPVVDERGVAWRTSEIITPLRFDPPIFAGAMTLSWFEFIDDKRREGGFTLQVTIQFISVPSPAGADPARYIKISFVARSPCSSWSEAFEFIEVAHVRLGERLVDLTTDAVRATWGQE